MRDCSFSNVKQNTKRWVIYVLVGFLLLTPWTFLYSVYQPTNTLHKIELYIYIYISIIKQFMMSNSTYMLRQLRAISREFRNTNFHWWSKVPKLPEDGIPMPKHVEMGVHHELCFTICILLYLFVGWCIEYRFAGFSTWRLAPLPRAIFVRTDHYGVRYKNTHSGSDLPPNTSDLKHICSFRPNRVIRIL